MEYKGIYCINLTRRGEKLMDFLNGVPRPWPYVKTPVPIDAIDGQLVTPPQWWKTGKGAWGCYRSHLGIIENALNQGIESILIFEDDALFRPDFPERVKRFEASMPTPENAWIYYGGQHLKRATAQPEPINSEVYRPFNVNRTHAYAIRGRAMMERIYRHLTRNDWKTAHHIDHHYGTLCEEIYREKGPVFCPAEWLVDQRAGYSDVAYKEKPDKMWDGAEILENHLYHEFYAVLGTHSSGSSALAGVLYCLGVHLGNQLVGKYGRPPINGGEAVDLRNLFEAAAPVPATNLQIHPDAMRARLREFVNRRRAEAVRKGTCAAGKYPQMACAWETLKEILGDRLRLIICDRPMEKAIDSLQRRFKNLPPEAVAAHQNWIKKCIEEAAANVPAANVHRVEYKSLLNAPEREIDGLCDFMNLPADETARRAAASYIDPTKNHH